MVFAILSTPFPAKMLVLLGQFLSMNSLEEWFIGPETFILRTLPHMRRCEELEFEHGIIQSLEVQLQMVNNHETSFLWQNIFLSRRVPSKGVPL